MEPLLPKRSMLQNLQNGIFADVIKTLREFLVSSGKGLGAFLSWPGFLDPDQETEIPSCVLCRKRKKIVKKKKGLSKGILIIQGGAPNPMTSILIDKERMQIQDDGGTGERCSHKPRALQDCQVRFLSTLLGSLAGCGS